MSPDSRLLSQLIRALNEGDHPVLRRLAEQLARTPSNPVELRRLCELLSSAPPVDPSRPGEALRCRLGAQLTQIALDRERGWASPSAVQRRLAEGIRLLRLHGMRRPEALAALLGARWLRAHDPAWALEMARRAADILGDFRRAATLRGRTDPALQDAFREAQQLIREILAGTPSLIPEGAALAAPEPAPPIASSPEEPAARPPAGSLRPAKLFMASLTLLPDAHPHAGGLQFQDPQTTERRSDEAEVLIEALEVDGQIYRPYVERGMDPIVRIRPGPNSVRMLRVLGDSMREAGIEPGDLILAQGDSDTRARDPSRWASMQGQLVLAVLPENNSSEAASASVVKRLIYHNGRWWLHAENPAFEDVPLEPGRCRLYKVLAILKPAA